MHSQVLYEAFEIHQCTSVPQHKSMHGHTFFELLFIERGTGIQHLNDHHLAYEQGDIFFITPEDKHSFDVVTESRFTSIRFSKVYFDTIHQQADYSEWFKKLEYIFYNTYQSYTQLISCAEDKQKIIQLMQLLIHEHQAAYDFSSHIIKGLVHTILNLIARNIKMKKIGVATANDPTKINEIIDFIQLNIYTPKQLQNKNIAVRFNLSPNYVSEYFRKYTGQNLKSYIQEYRVKLVETKLKFSDLSISEIAHQLNYTDEKHLNKIFKQHHQMTPTQYRLSYTQAVPESL